MSAALIAAVALVVASGAGAAKTRGAPTKIDVSTKAAVVHYLRSIHVNPKGVVIQRGLRNYAGPNCPGKRWTCASTARTVVQIASAGGKNTFRCSAARCAVVQVAAAAAKMNKAVCVKTTGLGASCTINQSSSGTTGNQAIVWEDAGKLTGLTQTALYTASITQKATGSGANTACAHQAINIDGSTGKNNTSAATVALDAHQSVAITQDSASGGNIVEDASQPVNGVPGCVSLPTSCPTSLTSPCGLSQTQTLSSTATSKGTIVQNENKTDSGPNLTLDIKQNQSPGFLGTATGANKAIFTQTNTLTAIANTPAGATQWQSSANGGLLAAVNQDSRDVSTSVARQREAQCEDAAPSGLTACVTGSGSADAPSGYPLSQTQYGPMRKAPGDSSQTGNTGDSFTVVQSSQQDNDTHSGQTNVIEGGFFTDGTGSVTQTATVDGQTSSSTQAGSGDVSGSMTCSGTSCTATPPPPPTITSAPPNPSNSSDATFTFSDSDANATFVCQLDGGGYSPCTSPQTYNNLGDGSHTFDVKAKNPTTGDLSDPTSYTWMIDTSANPSFTWSGNQLTATNVDVAEFGYGGMRTVGTGSISVTGITSTVLKAYLYWNGPTNSTSASANASVNFAGQAVTGTNIGIASSNCWDGSGYINSQSYRADVTSLVTGNGTYALSNFTKADADANGVSLVVFYSDGNTANNRTVVLWNGNDSNIAQDADPGGWDETLTGVPYPGSGSATLDFVVSDGQQATDDALVLNGNTLVSTGAIFEGSTPGGPYVPNPPGSLWDVESFDITGFLSSGSNNLHLTTGLASDCLSLVVAAANVPASAPILLGPASAPRHVLRPAAAPALAPRAGSSGNGVIARTSG